MGSLYHVMHGMDPLAPELLKVLDMSAPNVNQGKWRSGRFRDIHLNADGTKIILLTRNGGGNREHWSGEVHPPGPDCDCPGCTITHHLPKHPQYLSDKDDEYDRTFAYVYFKVPDWAAARMKDLATGQDPPTLREKSDAAIARLKQMTSEQIRNDPKLGPLSDALGNVINQFKKNQH